MADRVHLESVGGKFYRENNDRMPTFAKHANSAKAGLMTAKEIELLAKWLRGELE